MNNHNYTCPRCHRTFPLTNKTLHDLHCQGSNFSQYNRGVAPPQLSNSNFQNNINNNNFNQNRSNNMNNMTMNNNMMNNYYMNNMNNLGSISTNINTFTNSDGTMTEIKIEMLQNGDQRITKTKYDKNNNIISRQSQIQKMNNFNDNNNVQRTTDQNGNVTETRIQRLPYGGFRTNIITRDRYGNIISQSSSSNGNNMMNNMQFGFNCMNNTFNNNMNMMNDMMNNMYNNNMNMMNNMYNNNMNMMNNNNMVGNNNVMMNDINENLNNGVDINLLNSLETTKLNDVSNLEGDKKICVICMEDFHIGDEVIYIPCLHVFHKDCLLEWFRGHDFCPICKFKFSLENLQ